jgi:hypothetical protein
VMVNAGIVRVGNLYCIGWMKFSFQKLGFNSSTSYLNFVGVLFLHLTQLSTNAKT